MMEDEMDVETARRFCEAQTQQHFGLTVDEFIRQVESGELTGEDSGHVVHLSILVGARLRHC